MSLYSRRIDRDDFFELVDSDTVYHTLLETFNDAKTVFYFYIDGNDVFDSDSDKDQAIEKSVQFMIDCLKLDQVQINISFNEFFTAAQIDDIVYSSIS